MMVENQLFPLIKELNFSSIIDDVPYLSRLQREFYVTYLENRRKILFN